MTLPSLPNISTLPGFLSSTPMKWMLLVIAIALAVLVHGLVWRVIRHYRHDRGGLGWRLANRLRRPARLMAVVIALILAVPALDLRPGIRGLLEQLSVAVIITILGWTLIVAVDFLTERSLGKWSLDDDEDVTARKHVTQLRVLKQTLRILIFLLTAALVLSTFQSVRQYGISLFASAGAAGLVLGFAARPVLANLIAGIQIALTQPIRINDVVIVEDEWGWVEEIGATYVVIRIWDLRRLIVPLTYFIEQPFQNWTREQPSIIGTVTWYLDYTLPVEEMRTKLKQVVEASPLWDRKVVNLQVVDSNQDTIQVRALVSARNSPTAWDLRCAVREEMIRWLQAEHPGALPRRRGEVDMRAEATMAQAAE